MPCLMVMCSESPFVSCMFVMGNLVWKKLTPVPIGFPFLLIVGHVTVSVLAICLLGIVVLTISVMLIKGNVPLMRRPPSML